MFLVILKALRPKQWIKNFFVFVPLIFSREFKDIEAIKFSILVFGIFCLTASGIYLINDVLDRENDRKHHRKKHRPIAAGQLPVSIAILIGILLLGAGTTAAFCLNLQLGYIIIGYIALQVVYSFFLKHIVIIDLLSIAVGFVLRIFAGAAIIEVSISSWLLVITLLLALLLAAGKRLQETKTTNLLSRKVLNEYSPQFLDSVIKIILPATLVSYLFYSFQASQSHYFFLTVPIVVYGLLRYLLILESSSVTESPTELLLSDRPLLISVVLWGTTTLVILSFS